MVDKFNTDYVKNLPDAYSKAASSNNVKILEIERHALVELRESISQIFDSLDIDKATGFTLDMYGEMVGQKRGLATDSQYRPLIKTRIIRNLTNGDYNSIVNSLSLAFDCSPSELVFSEAEEAATVILEGLPIVYINKVGLTAFEAVAIIKELIPAGVTLESVEFEGTFEFGASDTEYDEEAGFGNIDQTIGGTLGMVASGKESDLPI